MKPIWYIIGVACVLISTIGRMADSLSDVLITLGVIALVVLVIWLFETGKIRLNERLGSILKKIGVGIFVVVGIAYLVAMVGFVTYKVATEGDRQGIMLLGIASAAFGISWYISRWQRIKYATTTGRCAKNISGLLIMPQMPSMVYVRLTAFSTGVRGCGLIPRMSIKMHLQDWIHLRLFWLSIVLKPTVLLHASPDVYTPI